MFTILQYEKLSQSLRILSANYRSKFISAMQFYYLPFFYCSLAVFPIRLFVPSCEHRPDSMLTIIRRYLWSNMWDVHYDNLPENCRYYLPFGSTVTRSVKHATVTGIEVLSDNEIVVIAFSYYIGVINSSTSPER